MALNLPFAAFRRTPPPGVDASRAGTAHDGWIGCAPAGAGRRVAAHVVRPAAPGGDAAPAPRPVVRWVEELAAGAAADDGSAEALRRPIAELRRRRPQAARCRRVALLRRGQYVVQTMDAPADVPRAQWADAARWRLGDGVGFAVDAAAVQALPVPDGASYRAQPQLIAVAAGDAQVRPIVEAGVRARLPWQAVDVLETALRNLSLLGTPSARTQALLHAGAHHATLVVTWHGELLWSHQIDLLGRDDARERDADADDGAPASSFERVGIEMQRLLDTFERAYGQVALARLLVTPMPGAAALQAHLAALLDVPVAVLDAAALLDLDAVPALRDDPLALHRALPAIGAALRDD